MKTPKIVSALSQVDDDIVSEAACEKKIKRNIWLKWGSIAACFAEALGKDIALISAEADFFRDLEGTSLDYFTLLGIIRSRLGVDIIASEGSKLNTVRSIADYIKSAK